MDTSVPKSEFVVRSKQGIYLMNDTLTDVGQGVKISGDNNITTNVIFSRDGGFLLIQEKTRVYSVNVDTNTTSTVFEGPNFRQVYLSPANKHAVVIGKHPEHYLLTTLSFPDMNVIAERELKRYKAEQWPLIQYSENDEHYLYLQNGELKVYKTETQELLQAFKAKQCENFVIQPKKSEGYLIILYSLQQELQANSQGSLIIYDQSAPNKVLFDKPVPDASEIQIKWSPDGKTFIFIKSSSSDSSNQSYFGQSQVYLWDQKKLDFASVPTYEGPIHSVVWSQDRYINTFILSQYFMMVSGYMPSATVLFNAQGKPQFEFGKDHKNQVHWSELQRFAIIAGFGNLDGAISVWDTVKRKQVGSCKSKAASQCLWLPCSRKFVTSRVTPRMNVDNAYTVFDYQGEELRNVPFESLYEVIIRPVPVNTFKDRSPSPPRRQQQQKQEPQKKLFVPPGGSGLLAQQIRAQRQSEGARVLSQNETFGQQTQSWGLQRSNDKKEQYPPGYVPPPTKEKKKRIRNKKPEEER